MQGLRSIFKGIFTAIITPFKRNTLDVESLERLIEIQVASAVDGIVIADSTGEGHSLSQSEYCTLVKNVAAVLKNRVPLVVSVPHCSTTQAIDVITHLKNKTIEAFLVAAPYYLRPQQEGIFEHYRQITNKTKANIIMCNIPHRCAINVENATTLKIMDLPAISAIVDLSGDLEYPTILRRENDRVPILTGNDTTYAAHRLNGGDGIVSTLSNLIPKEMVTLERAIYKGNYENIKKLHKLIFPLAKSMSCETNPIPLKYAVSCIYKYVTPNVRLPLTDATTLTRQLIHTLLSNLEREKQEHEILSLIQS
ncbi:4-hydroxy-tetrahydrodipicolinate synthase [Neorickettsia sennetsu]|uniref:4-hydroxy-tetrahydrodipicolinate synthase n=1 Tax=Ehrlichia sennetsu (strain ATCC VR-367 / Miyayama) TaxID=222891 RepID=Q2GCK3_EHRS3|nr:4-hydroxy-tetrahydrodipicolinate synthase [Neorickettsia sennetsu]ABD45662.1 dihydrodipicolinate synthase [Neorickettsia sennetsu str. Miyayama]